MTHTVVESSSRINTKANSIDTIKYPHDDKTRLKLLLVELTA